MKLRLEFALSKFGQEQQFVIVQPCDRFSAFADVSVSLLELPLCAE